jgi:immune inhibitor A
MSSKLPVLVVLLLVGFCCCLGAICVLSGGLAAIGIILPGSVVQGPVIEEQYVRPTPLATRTVAPTRVVPTPLPDPATAEPGGGPALLEPETVTPAEESLNTLKDTIVPINDPRDLAMRLLGIHDIPETIEPPPAFPNAGDTRQFYVQNAVTNQNFQIDATLRYVGDNVYFWIQNGVSYRAADLERLGRTFDQEIYPTTRNYFGSEWKPGIDSDPRLYILYAGGLGTRIAGYFSSKDSVHPLAHKFSNGNEMFLLNADTVGLGDEFAYSVLAHEFQHMIHWYQDRNESSWLNEGFSELAAFLNGYGGGGFDYVYTGDPTFQLNDWPNSPGGTTPHYGASFLFVTYFLDRFGDDATQAVVSHPDNGLESFDAVLADMGFTDPLTGLPVTADDVFSDWAVANYLRDSAVSDGRYTYHNYANGPKTRNTEAINRCPQDWQDRTVRQYGVHYISINCTGSFTLNFEGGDEVSIVPMDPYSGDYAFWSNKGDESNMTLTQTFDFREVTGPLTLSYQTWYDIESDYDYVYLTASEDGQTWDIVKTPRGTDLDPSGNSYGWGYNGLSGDWVLETVDISQFAGKQVQLRFEYITDAAVNGEGFLLDDVSIPEIDYFTDFETDDDGWEADGFVRIQNRLPQTYRISLIEIGRNTVVETIDVAAGESIDLQLDSGEVVLVVSGTTRFTRQPAEYRFRLTQ